MIEINLNGALPQAGTAGLRQTLLVASWSEQWYYWKSLCIFSIYLRVMSVPPPPNLYASPERGSEDQLTCRRIPLTIRV